MFRVSTFQNCNTLYSNTFPPVKTCLPLKYVSCFQFSKLYYFVLKHIFKSKNVCLLSTFRTSTYQNCNTLYSNIFPNSKLCLFLKHVSCFHFSKLNYFALKHIINFKIMLICSIVFLLGPIGAIIVRSSFRSL